MQSDPRINKIRKCTTMYEDFPKKGLKFLDIFPMIADSEILTLIIDIFVEQIKDLQYDKIFMLESRGFLFGVPLSLRTNKPCFPFRKSRKFKVQLRVWERLNRNQEVIAIQFRQYIVKGDRVVIVDDVLATGGTMNAAIKLAQQQGAEVVKVLLINQIPALKGRQALSIGNDKIYSMYDI